MPLSGLGATDKTDSVTVDFAAGGRFAILKGIVFDGGMGKNTDELVLRGTSEADAFCYLIGPPAR